MPVVDCDIDHTVPYAESHQTDTGCLASLCRYHRVIRHRRGWSYGRLGNGDYIFTSPFGQRYTTSSRDP